MRLFCFLPALVVTAVLALADPVPAGSPRDLAERHPAGKVVVQFLRLSINREWEKVAALVEPGSLNSMKSDYLKRVADPKLPFDEVQAMCRAVGVADEAALTQMTPVGFYVAFNQGLQKRYKVTDAINRRIAETLELNLLSIAEEHPDLVHLLVRTKHRTMTNFVQNLEVVSLVKTNGKWLVTLGERQTKYTPLSEVKHESPATPNPEAGKK
jgi:hypothetical protein